MMKSNLLSEQPLCTLALRWDDELAINFAARIKSETNPAPAKQALEQHIGDALSICHKVGRTFELVVAGPEIRLPP